MADSAYDSSTANASAVGEKKKSKKPLHISLTTNTAPEVVEIADQRAGDEPKLQKVRQQRFAAPGIVVPMAHGALTRKVSCTRVPSLDFVHTRSMLRFP